MIPPHTSTVTYSRDNYISLSLETYFLRGEYESHGVIQAPKFLCITANPKVMIIFCLPKIIIPRVLGTISVARNC